MAVKLCVCQAHALLTRHVKNGVCSGVPFYEAKRLTGRYDDQFDVTAFRLYFHFLRNWQATVCSGADHKALAFPGYLFLDGQGRMAKLLTEFFGWRLFAFAECSAVNHHVLVVRAAVDSQRTEGKSIEVRTSLLVPCVQALFLEVRAEKADQLCSTS